ALSAAAVALLMPEGLLVRGLLAPGDRSVWAPCLCRMLSLAFQVVVWVAACRLIRGRSPMICWLVADPTPEGDGDDVAAVARLQGIRRRRRAIAWTLLGAIGAIIALDAQGYSFTARRLTVTAAQSALLVGSCLGVSWLLRRAIDHHAWRWLRAAHWAGGRSALDGPGEVPTDLARRLRQLVSWIVPLLGLLAGSWVWNVDLALFRSISEMPLWSANATTWVTAGDVARALVLFLGTAAAWRHLGDFFTLFVYPRLPNDPGLRFALLTLC